MLLRPERAMILLLTCRRNNCANSVLLSSHGRFATLRNPAEPAQRASEKSLDNLASLGAGISAARIP